MCSGRNEVMRSMLCESVVDDTKVCNGANASRVLLVVKSKVTWLDSLPGLCEALLFFGHGSVLF